MSTSTALTIDDVWTAVTAVMKETLSVPGFATFMATTCPMTLGDGVLTIAVPNAYSRSWIVERCQNTILHSLQEKLGQSVLLDIQIQKLSAGDDEDPKDAYDEPGSMPRPVSVATQSPTSSGHANLAQPPASAVSSGETNAVLNGRYSFDTFVIGHNNRFAHAASVAVSQAPANAYNPLFIYGGVGLGKTHLMQAIGHKAVELKPSLKITYVSSEKFTNDLINAIRDNKTSQFREKYRSGDILLIDDIQFLADKERTQEEFFHTFNALYENNKQIVITSDRSPKEIPTLEDRLRSRFEWGLSVDIQTPDFETRVAILKKKAQVENMELDNEILSYLASQIPTNIRELEGALTRLVAYSSVMKRPMSLDLAAEAMSDMFKPSQRRPITIASIMRVVAQESQISVEDLCAKNRTKDVALARQIAMYLCRDKTKSSLPKIGQSFGGRDHTTVMHACDRVKVGINTDPDIKNTVERITHILEHSTGDKAVDA